MAGTCTVTNTGRFDAHRLLIGRDWPTHGMTIVGHACSRNVRHCLELALSSNVPGDFVELGVWRGGASLYARAVLNARLGVPERRAGSSRLVHLFDAFGLIKGYGLASDFLAVKLPAVKSNFETYGLTEGVHYHPGLFNESLPRFYARHKAKHSSLKFQIAVLRIDGNATLAKAISTRCTTCGSSRRSAASSSSSTSIMRL